MKYFLSDLIKNGFEPFLVNETVDFSAIASNHHDIRHISLVDIAGTGQLTSNDMVIFRLHIKCELILPCAITLDDVKYPIDVETEEFFSFAPNAKEEDFDYDVNIVKGQYLELAPVVWENIVLNIPLRVVSENAYERMQKQGDNWQIVDEDHLHEEEAVDPRFAVLKNLLKNKK